MPRRYKWGRVTYVQWIEPNAGGLGGPLWEPKEPKLKYPTKLSDPPLQPHATTPPTHVCAAMGGCALDLDRKNFVTAAALHELNLPSTIGIDVVSERRSSHVSAKKSVSFLFGSVSGQANSSGGLCHSSIIWQRAEEPRSHTDTRSFSD